MFSRIITSALLLPVLLGLSSFCPDEIVKDDMCFNLENSVVASYLQDAHAHYAEGIGRDGVSRLNMNVLGKDESPYMNQVVEQYDTPNWAELPAAVPVPSKGGTTVQVALCGQIPISQLFRFTFFVQYDRNLLNGIKFQSCN